MLRENKLPDLVPFRPVTGVQFHIHEHHFPASIKISKSSARVHSWFDLLVAFLFPHSDNTVAKGQCDRMTLGQSWQYTCRPIHWHFSYLLELLSNVSSGEIQQDVSIHGCVCVLRIPCDPDRMWLLNRLHNSSVCLGLHRIPGINLSVSHKRVDL